MRPLLEMNGIAQTYKDFLFHFIPQCCALLPAYLYLRSGENLSGSSSVGRARPCQGRGREFESRLPLEEKLSLFAIRLLAS